MQNLLEILRNMPSGRKLWCDIIGISEISITEDDTYPITAFSEGHCSYLKKDGASYSGCPCVLWPSVGYRSWDNWQEFLFLKGDIVVNSSGYAVMVDNICESTFTYYDGTKKEPSYCYDSSGYRFATKVEIKSFYDRLDSNGLVYDKEAGVIKYQDAIPRKFHIGDWIVYKSLGERFVAKITDIDFDKKRYITNNGNTTSIDFSAEHYMQKWSIDLAECGDILYIPKAIGNVEAIFMFKKRSSEAGQINPLLTFRVQDNIFIFNNESDAFIPDNGVVPATYEQEKFFRYQMDKHGYKEYWRGCVDSSYEDGEVEYLEPSTDEDVNETLDRIIEYVKSLKR